MTYINISHPRQKSRKSCCLTVETQRGVSKEARPALPKAITRQDNGLCAAVEHARCAAAFPVCMSRSNASAPRSAFRSHCRNSPCLRSAQPETGHSDTSAEIHSRSSDTIRRASDRPCHQPGYSFRQPDYSFGMLHHPSPPNNTLALASSCSGVMFLTSTSTSPLCSVRVAGRNPESNRSSSIFAAA